nr:hypothetical protein [Mesorhizobium sp.]
MNLVGPGDTPELVFSIGIKKSDMRRLLAEATRRRAMLLEQWENIHGNAD